MTRSNCTVEYGVIIRTSVWTKAVQPYNPNRLLPVYRHQLEEGWMDIHVKGQKLFLRLTFHTSHAKTSTVPQIPGYSTLHTCAHTMTFMQMPSIPCLLATFHLFFKDISATSTQLVTSCEPSLSPKIVTNTVLLLVSDMVSCLSHLRGNDCFLCLSSPSSWCFFGKGPIICSCLCLQC